MRAHGTDGDGGLPRQGRIDAVKISVIGCGYLGAVHAAGLASVGHEVVGVDIDHDRIAALATGHAPFFEPGLDDLLAEGLANGRLRFSSDMGEVSDALVHFIAVGTPQAAVGGGADLTYLHAAVTELVPYLKKDALIAGKSTVPVGTARRIEEQLRGLGNSTTVAWNPEFLREGFAIEDTLKPDRLVYGVEEGAAGAHAIELLDDVYRSVLAQEIPRLVTSRETAELVKVSANAFLATKISFINAISELAQAAGADVADIADAIGYDVRIGRRFLNAGVGFGGGCLPKDIRALRSHAESLGLGRPFAFLEEVDLINLRQRDRVVAAALEELGENGIGRRVAILGLAFKPNSDDIRDSPALDVAVRLQQLGISAVATDPHALENVRRAHPEIQLVETPEEAIGGADLVILLTEWKEFRELNPSDIVGLPAVATILDGRNTLDPAVWRAAGWKYRSLGRP